MTATAPVFAQNADADVQEVVVSGSRVITNGYQAPTPITVISQDQLEAAAPSSISDALNQLPQFRGSAQPQTSGLGTTGTVGQSFLSLRNLGSNRTLLLLDGRRLVPSSPTGVFDVSLLPESLVQRVDVVTGGASAAYGSDAVSGVVNFILDTNFTGFKTSVQGGISQQGDAENGRIEIAGGTKLFGDRGHLIFSAEYYRNGGVEYFGDRDWYGACARINNPALVPNFILACGVNSAQFTAGGMIPSGPLGGTQFVEGGRAIPFNYGSLRTTSTMVGGTGAGAGPYPKDDVGAYFPMIAAIDRINGFGHFKFDITDQVSAFAELLVAQGTAKNNSTAPWQGTTSGYTIQRDNAFLPDSVRTRMVAANVTSFPLNRYDYDFDLLRVLARNNTYEAVTGFNADVAGWKINGYYEHGENRFYESTLNNPIANNEYNAADAVLNPATGQIVCRSTLTNPGNGCVPINLFGYGSPSRAALDYVLGTSEQWLRVKQDVAELSGARDLFDLWGAGPVKAAVGAGYRKESSVQTVDPISSSIKHASGGYLGFPASLEGQLGGFDRGNPQPIAGSYNVKELFGEVAVPLLKGRAWAEALDLNASLRHTDYSISGGVTSWKVGLTYEPFETGGVRLRAARSRDIRAPNISELFLNGTQGQGNLTDRFQPVGSPNRTPVVYTRSFGNSLLEPEKADTLTFGVVYQASWLPGLSMSVDYYDIDLADAIGTLGGQTTIDQCFAGAALLCNQLHRDVNGVLIAVDTPFLNINSRKTNGVDFEVGYRTPVGVGDLNVRMIANYVDKLTSQNIGAAETDAAGSLGNPHWQANLIAQYRVGQASVFLQERYVAGTALDNTLLASQLDPSLNRVNRVFYTDVTFNYGDPEKVQGFLTVNNAFDKAPPSAPSNYFVYGTAGGGTSTFYDLVGRTYTLGLKYKF
ncbi:MAG TPA: TonB-dependent receptor plug domain-containing protein [Steroidobacteraceae bacterium]|nr:TonB-dependent receptor plug domain-containing protein [Steroidobacteraceae bacterium]